MIASLKGLVGETAEESVIIEVNGVGYLVFASQKTLSRMPKIGEAVQLFIETHVREDHIHLFGFLSADERAAFRLLTTVQGVGNKMALAILSVIASSELYDSIAAGDKAAFTQANGVGPKLATRIISELKDKVGGLSFSSTNTVTAKDITAIDTKNANNNGDDTTNINDDDNDAIRRDALSALVNLGYNRTDAYQAVAKILRDHQNQANDNDKTTLSVGDAIRLSLKLLSS